MRRTHPTVYLVALWAAVAGGCVSHEVTARTFKVLRVVDGDTFVIRYDGEPTYVRFHGMDAPEPREPGGPAATAALRGLIDGRTVRIDFPGRRKRDNFGRLICNVQVGDVAIGPAMVRAGHAVLYQKGDRR